MVNHDVLLELDGEYTALSSTVDGGLRNGIKYVVHHQVPQSFDQDPMEEIGRVYDELGVGREKALTFLTATELPRNHTIYVAEDNSIIASITMGLTNTYNIMEGIQATQDMAMSTINMAIIINRPMTMPALVDAYRLVSEAKAVVLGSKLGVHGTVSDALAVMAVQAEGGIKYAGPATEVGRALIKVVSAALSEALIRYEVGWQR